MIEVPPEFRVVESEPEFHMGMRVQHKLTKRKGTVSTVLRTTPAYTEVNVYWDSAVYVEAHAPDVLQPLDLIERIGELEWRL